MYEPSRESFPSHVYVNPVDLKKIKKALHVVARKEYPRYKQKVRDGIVGTYMLQYAPNSDKAVNPGYVLVDDKALVSDLKNAANAHQSRRALDVSGIDDTLYVGPV